MGTVKATLSKLVWSTEALEELDRLGAELQHLVAHCEVALCYICLRCIKEKGYNDKTRKQFCTLSSFHDHIRKCYPLQSNELDTISNRRRRYQLRQRTRACAVAVTRREKSSRQQGDVNLFEESKTERTFLPDTINDSELSQISPLGAGNVEEASTKNSLAALPYFDSVKPDQCDMVIIQPTTTTTHITCDTLESQKTGQKRKADKLQDVLPRGKKKKRKINHTGNTDGSHSGESQHIVGSAKKSPMHVPDPTENIESVGKQGSRKIGCPQKQKKVSRVPWSHRGRVCCICNERFDTVEACLGHYSSHADTDPHLAKIDLALKKMNDPLLKMENAGGAGRVATVTPGLSVAEKSISDSGVIVLSSASTAVEDIPINMSDIFPSGKCHTDSEKGMSKASTGLPSEDSVAENDPKAVHKDSVPLERMDTETRNITATISELQQLNVPLPVTETEVVSDRPRDDAEAKVKIADSNKICENGTLKGKKVICPICNKEVDMNCYLKHVTTVHVWYKIQKRKREKRPMLCALCGKVCKSERVYYNHQRIVHKGIRPKRKPCQYKPRSFHCDKCPFVTSEIRRLKDHIQFQHEGKKVYHCTRCDYQTWERTSLRDHEYRHLDTKRFSCDHCEYQCIQKKQLRRHLSRKHEIDLPKTWARHGEKPPQVISIVKTEPLSTHPEEENTKPATKEMASQTKPRSKGQSKTKSKAGKVTATRPKSQVPLLLRKDAMPHYSPVRVLSVSQPVETATKSVLSLDGSATQVTDQLIPVTMPSTVWQREVTNTSDSHILSGTNSTLTVQSNNMVSDVSDDDPGAVSQVVNVLPSGVKLVCGVLPSLTPLYQSRVPDPDSQNQNTIEGAPTQESLPGTSLQYAVPMAQQTQSQDPGITFTCDPSVQMVTVLYEPTPEPTAAIEVASSSLEIVSSDQNPVADSDNTDTTAWL